MKNSSLSLKERSTRQIFAIFAASEDCDLFYSNAILFSLKWFVVPIKFHIVSCDKSVCIERFVFMYKYCTKTLQSIVRHVRLFEGMKLVWKLSLHLKVVYCFISVTKNKFTLRLIKLCKRTRKNHGAVGSHLYQSILCCHILFNKTPCWTPNRALNVLINLKRDTVFDIFIYKHLLACDKTQFVPLSARL